MELWFVNKGKKRVVVQIRETTVGVPLQTVIAESYIEPKDVKIDGTATRITWSPVFCHAGQEYAIVLLTDDGENAVKVAELGKYDAVNSRWVTSQPYQVGVLLSSSNASTWTPHQNLDLTFRLLAAKFSENSHVVDLGKVTANNVSDLIVLTNVEKVGFDTNVEFILTDEEGKENFLSDNLPLALRERLSGELTVKANLKGSKEKSPVLYPGLQLVLGNLSESGDYVTRSITAGSNTKVTITYDALIPGTADVKAYVQKSVGEWQLVNLTTGKPIGENWVERTHVLSNFNANKSSISRIIWKNVYQYTSSDSKLAGSGNVEIPAGKTVAILLYTSSYLCSRTQVSQGMLASNYVYNYGQFIQWGIYNIRSNFLTTGLEIDVERTLKAWQCPGLSETYELWR